MQAIDAYLLRLEAVNAQIADRIRISGLKSYAERHPNVVRMRLCMRAHNGRI